MGHNMHDLDPIFRQFSYSIIMRNILFKAMHFVNPLVVQSMYIFKVKTFLSELNFRMRELAGLWNLTKMILTSLLSHAAARAFGSALMKQLRIMGAFGVFPGATPSLQSTT